MNEIDYTEYLSIDNGHGVLISKWDAYVLDKYHIDYRKCSSLTELMFLIRKFLEDDFDENLEELEDVLVHLTEVHYYQEVNK